MRVRELMKTNVETVGQDEPAEGAYARMRLKRIHHLVVTSGAEVVGVLSERDLGGKDREAMRRTHKVLSFMTPYAVKARPALPVRRAATLMRGWSIGCLPVVERGRLVGIVTVSDLLDLIARGGEPAARRPARSVRRSRRPASSAGGASRRRS